MPESGLLSMLMKLMPRWRTRRAPTVLKMDEETMQYLADHRHWNMPDNHTIGRVLAARYNVLAQQSNDALQEGVSGGALEKLSDGNGQFEYRALNQRGRLILSENASRYKKCLALKQQIEVNRRSEHRNGR